ncbi:hypothetical protein [Paenibacillus sabuli]
MTFGPSIRILEPPELKQLVRELAKGIVQLYQADPDSDFNFTDSSCQHSRYTLETRPRQSSDDER